LRYIYIEKGGASTGFTKDDPGVLQPSNANAELCFASIRIVLRDAEPILLHFRKTQR